MAINYATWFGCLGEFVQRINRYKGLHAGFDTDFTEVEADLDAAGAYTVLDGLRGIFDGMKDTVNTFIDSMQTRTDMLVQHRDMILDELSLGDETGIQTILANIYRDMVDNAQTIDRSTVSIGAVTEDKENANAGTVLLGKVLDGVNAPHTSYSANPEYAGVDSELAIPTDDLNITCVTDSETDGIDEGSETWSFDGDPGVTDPYTWQSRGSGTGPTITTLNSYGYFLNADFEEFTGDVPNNWDLDDGTAGTHVDDDAVTPYHRLKQLKLTGDAVQTDIQISQVSAIDLIPLQRYCFACYVKGQAGTSAGTLTIQFEGTGYAPGVTEKIEMNAAALAAQVAYGIESFFVTMPKEIPDDMKLVIKWTGTPSAHSVRIDHACFGPVTYFNGIHAVMVGGAEKFLRGDRFKFTVTNNDAGLFQAFFRDTYGVQLPSDAAPTIADALAT